MYAVIVIVVLLILIGVPTYFLTRETPTCFDGEQNHSETGIDCGGECRLICAAESKPVVVSWSRAFEVTEGVYNAVAYLENQNFNAVAESVPYSFKFFDAKNILVAERQGVTTLSRDGVIPIFEAQVVTANRKPERTFFEFSEAPVWEKKEEQEELFVEDVLLRNTDTLPELIANIENESVDSYREVEVVATLFDARGNAFAASRTIIERLEGRSVREVTFTWPTPFVSSVSQIDIIPRIIR